MDKIAVSIVGVLLIVFIYWFFFRKRDAVAVTKESGDIIVDGGYRPSIIKIKKGQKTTISILRKDPNTCLEEFILPDFKISKYLPLNEKVEIEITPEKSGEFTFHCGMNMFHGKVIVE